MSWDFQRSMNALTTSTALESAHGIAGVIKRAPKMRPDQLIIANLSGRGDKDVLQAAEFLLEGKKP